MANAGVRSVTGISSDKSEILKSVETPHRQRYHQESSSATAYATSSQNASFAK